jgi:hypothetical protein
VILYAGDDGCHEIMWDVVRQWRNFPSIRRPSREECAALKVTKALFENTVVAPWYRKLGDQVGNEMLATCCLPHALV